MLAIPAWTRSPPGTLRSGHSAIRGEIMSETLKNIVRVLLLIWFITISLFIFIPSYQLLSESQKEKDRARAALAQLPLPPSVPKEIRPTKPTNSPENITQLVKLYEQSVAAYDKEITAYVKFADGNAKAVNRTDTYNAVVKGTLATMMTTFLTALLGWIFASAVVGLTHNYYLYKKGLAPEKVHLL
jgi:hypothetical protein